LIYSIVCLRASYREYKKSKIKDHEKKHQAKYKSLIDEQKWWKFSLAVIATIICMEITDSSEFALFSLALAYDATCVIIGAFLAHAACAVLAVSIGKIVSKYVSECITQLAVGLFFLWLTCVWTYYCVEEGIVYFG
jgi:putative Ca2+/H+ antiporter (TMEM165/GDT1 family)